MRTHEIAVIGSIEEVGTSGPFAPDMGGQGDATAVTEAALSPVGA